MTTTVIDDFADPSQWMAVASGQAQLRIARDAGPKGEAMRLDFDFKGGGGFVVARKELSLPLPASFAFSFEIRGEAPPNKFEFKLVDPSNQNVWRYQQEPFDFSADWRPLRLKSSQLEFAWGPAGGGAPTRLGAIEFAIAAGTGGKGTVWIADLRFEDRSIRTPPIARASSALPGHAPECVIDGDAATGWRSEPAGPQWLSLDFQQAREYGGLTIQWDPIAPARAFEVEVSDDGEQWTQVYSAQQAAGPRSYIYLPATESRYLRLQLRRGRDEQGFGVIAIDVEPYEFSRSLNAFFQHIARREPRGRYPRYFYGEQSYWTPVGVPNGVTRAILNEEGMLEVDEGAFSIEPFLYLDGRLITWAQAKRTQRLEQDWLPLPSSCWRVDDIALEITACATGESEQAILYARYRIHNAGATERELSFFTALRPFQVTPPWQSYNMLGGVSPIAELAFWPDTVWVNHRKAVIPLTTPDNCGAAAFEQGAVTDYLQGGMTPPAAQVSDAFGYASGALGYDLTLAPGAVQTIYLAIPFGSSTDPAVTLLPEGVAGVEQFDRAAWEWTNRLGQVEYRLPPAARDAANTVKTAAAHILLNRDGPALQPGPRRYTRCWIRDGAGMAAALLRLGCAAEIRDFIRWYARYQADDGHIPCCVDRAGPDWLPEYDSLGEFIYTIMEYYRFTGDRDFARELWPAVVKTVDCLEALRNRRLSGEFQTPDKQACYGLLPESASHEGYLAHPVHAYWDDFWALRGLKDAAALAELVADRPQAARLAALRDAFEQTLFASIETTMRQHNLAYIPGSVEWADFDPSATANAITLLDGLPQLPAAAIKHTFTEYLVGFHNKHGGLMDWANYTPYEIRILGALARLGWRSEAYELLRFFLNDRRPRAWNQWPEIAWRDPAAPGHIGDIPHAWIGAEYILAVRTLFAYECEADRSLVIGAGIPADWLSEEPIGVERLPTWWGRLSFSIRQDAGGAVRIELGGELTLPPGGIVLKPPLTGPLQGVQVNGKSVFDFDPTQITIAEFPASVTLLQ